MITQIPWWIWMVLYFWLGPVVIPVVLGCTIGFLHGIYQALRYLGNGS